MRVVIIGDIGVTDGMIHIGDEAMFETFARELGARGAKVTGLSAAPTDSAARYGIDSVSRIGFDLRNGREAARERMRQVIEGGLDADDPAHAVVAAIQSADGVAIAGGGNMASNWPAHIYERATLAALARSAGVPLVVSGQTLGPELVEEDRDLIRGILDTAALVGVREGASFELAAALNPTAAVVRTIDDASFLVDSPTNTEPYALVSLSTHLGGVPRSDAVADIAALLDRVVAETGLPVLFHAHWASLDPSDPRGDSVLHDEVRAAMAEASGVVPTRSSTHSARAARAASLVVTSRYHPAVFAAPAGVPMVGIAVDEYTTVKLTGALGNFGQDTVVALGDLGASGAAALDRAWAERDSVRAAASTRALAERARTAAWWDRIATVFTPAR
jgi:polysaccharide pyruvyl transferase WcaK-like protein